MTNESILTPLESRPLSGRTLSLEIEPSYPLISAMIRFFREQNLHQQSLALCRMGLEFFPGDEGLRLLKALAHLDLGETEEALKTIRELTRSWGRMAPTLSALSHHPRSADWGPLKDWLSRLAQTFSQSPLKETETPPDLKSTASAENRWDERGSTSLSPILAKENGSSISTEDPGGLSTCPVGKEGETKVLATLNSWLTQLKGSQG